jgi:flagellar hook-associated protein 3 FlgL
MRVTNMMMFDGVQRQLQRRTSSLAEAQDKLASGKRLTKPSDDPMAVARAMALRRAIAENEQYDLNADAASSWISASDSALESADNVLLRAHDLALRGATSSLSGTERQALAAEVDQLLQEMVDQANTKFGDDYLFAGFKNDQPPFVTTGSPPTAVNYQGDSGQLSRSVGQGRTVTVNLEGQTTFQPAMQALLDLRDALESGDGNDVANMLPSLESAEEVLSAGRGELGARANGVKEVIEQLETFQVELKARLSRDEDLDLQEAALTFSLDETTYKASLATASSMLSATLIDYLR